MAERDDILELISAMRAETEESSLTPDRVGYLLQRMLDVMPSQDLVVNAIRGYVVINSTDELPENPSALEQMIGYLLDTTLYVYVGTGGDTLDGKYQSAQLKGEDGNPGNDGVGFEDASTPTIADGTWIITLTNGDTITVNLNHEHPQYLKYELVSTLPASPDSGTLYLIAAE